MHIEILKAEITGQLFLKWEYDEVSATRKTNHKAKSDAPIHEDLRGSIKALAPHFVLLTEMKKKPDVVKDIELHEASEKLLNKFIVQGFQIEETKGVRYITLTGMKILSNGKAVKFETPKTDRGNDEEAYEFFDELEEAIEVVQEETLQYMEGKQAEHPQTEMFDDEEFDPEEGETENAEFETQTDAA